MDILNSVLEEELKRLRKLEKMYKNKISDYSRGSLIRKKIGNGIYYYLNYRENGKGVFKYIGKLNEKKLQELKNEISERRKFEKLLRNVMKDIRKLEKIVNAKQR